MYIEMRSFDIENNALKQAEVVVLILPLTDQTHHLIDESKFSLMKNGTTLVNIARGAIIDTNVLQNHIDRFTGAVLDVFEEEPLNENSTLWSKQNIILTPHNSFVGEGNGERLKEIIVENLI